MNIKKLFIFLAAFIMCVNASAFKSDDAGQYVVVDKDGEKGHIVFRLQQDNEQWFLQAQTAQGEWENVSCETDCELNTSSQSNNEAYFGKDIVEQATVSCMHNEQLAFCRLDDDKGLLITYAMIVLSEQNPKIVRLTRVVEE